MIRNMAKIAFIWEMGGGLGHLARLAPIAATLAARGHEIAIAARDSTHATRLFPGSRIFTAPVASAPQWARIREPASFAEILFNSGCCDRATLGTLIDAWRDLIDEIRPDVAVLDFSPLALLALQGSRCRTVMLGTGFACPPDISPLPDLRTWQDHYADRLWMNECEVLEQLNEQLARLGQPPLPRVGALSGLAHANLLASFPELDHYVREHSHEGTKSAYVGTWSDAQGKPPGWPTTGGTRIFAYLKPFPALPELLRKVAQSPASALVYLAGEDLRIESGALPESVRIVTEPVDIQRAARECKLAILNAGHGTTAEMLLCGTPILQIPLLVEQGMVARNVERIGAGIMTPLDDPGAITTALDRLLQDERYSDAAAGFARKYSSHDPVRAIAAVARRIEELAAPNGSG